MSITIVNLSMFFQNSNGEKRQKLLQSVSDSKQANNYQCACGAEQDQSGPVYLGCSNTKPLIRYYSKCVFGVWTGAWWIDSYLLIFNYKSLLYYLVHAQPQRCVANIRYHRGGGPRRANF